MKKYSQLIRYITSDFIAGALAWLLFNVVRYILIAQGQGFASLGGFLLSFDVMRGQILIPFGWIILFYYSGYYNNVIEKSRLSEFFVTLTSVLIGTVVVFFVVVLKTLPAAMWVYYEQFFSLFSFTFVLIYLGRWIITRRAALKIRAREWTVKALVLGNGERAEEIMKLLDKPTESMAYTIVSMVDIEEFDKLDTIIKNNEIETLIVAVDTEDNEELLNLLYSLYQYKLPIKLPISYTRLLTGGMKIKTITGAPLVDVTDNNFPEAEKNIKLSLDKLVSAIVLLLLSPVYIYLMIKVKLDSKGPIFLKQERIGYRGKPFNIYKFRTMYEDAEKQGPALATESDTRITPYGRIMRKYRLDELPQFWNVLKGDMSLVGPRPERKYYIDQIVKEAPYYYLLHNVRPGITSWGMVKYGYASNVKQMIERMEFDILYYENMSLSIDLKILIYTVRTIVTGKGI